VRVRDNPDDPALPIQVPQESVDKAWIMKFWTRHVLLIGLPYLFSTSLRDSSARFSTTVFSFHSKVPTCSPN
jgi:hypothetical protein